MLAGHWAKSSLPVASLDVSVASSAPDTVHHVRIALVSPYSWTYPGGVTRHIEALSAELEAQGHEPDILAPFDPDDALSRRLHFS